MAGVSREEEVLMQKSILIAMILIAASWSAAEDQSTTKEIQAVVRKEPWKGWGGGEPLPEKLKGEQQPEKFTPFETPAGAKPKFIGKIDGVDSPSSAEVGVVYLIGVHWLKSDNYQWSRVKADGSFEI